MVGKLPFIHVGEYSDLVRCYSFECGENSIKGSIKVSLKQFLFSVCKTKAETSFSLWVVVMFFYFPPFYLRVWCNLGLWSRISSGIVY